MYYLCVCLISSVAHESYAVAFKNTNMKTVTILSIFSYGKLKMEIDVDGLRCAFVITLLIYA